MDRLHVATLNIRNLADRWFERLPALLADMATLQPDLLGLQEVVYPMQQDRLIGAAGEGHYAEYRAWAGRRVRQRPPRPAAAVRDRTSPASTSGATARRAIGWWRYRADGRSSSSSPTSTTSPQTPSRDEQAAALLAWLDDGSRSRRRVLMGDFNAHPEEPPRSASGRMAPDRRTPTRTARSPGDLAVRPDRASDGHRGPARPPRLHLGPRRGPRRIGPAAFDRPDPEDPTIYPSDHLGIAAWLEIG